MTKAAPTDRLSAETMVPQKAVMWAEKTAHWTELRRGSRLADSRAAQMAPVSARNSAAWLAEHLANWTEPYLVHCWADSMAHWWAAPKAAPKVVHWVLSSAWMRAEHWAARLVERSAL